MKNKGFTQSTQHLLNSSLASGVVLSAEDNSGIHGIKKSMPSRAYILMEDAFLYALVEKTLHDLLFHEKSEMQVLQVNGDIYTEHLWKDP